MYKRCACELHKCYLLSCWKAKCYFQLAQCFYSASICFKISTYIYQQLTCIVQITACKTLLMPPIILVWSLQATSGNQNNMLILQETCTDSSGSLVVYAPVDVQSMHIVMNGGDSAYVSLLPSGFAILPDGHNTPPGAVVDPAGSSQQSQQGSSESAAHGNNNTGSLVTVAFQILVNNLPTAKLTVESVDTVSNLLSCTIQKIKSALQASNNISP